MMPRKRWEESTDPAELLRAFHMRLTDRGTKPERGRKVTLYVAALCRRVWDELPWICRTLVVIAERLADGESLDPPLPRPFYNIAAPVRGIASDAVLGIVSEGGSLTRRIPQLLYPATQLARYEAELIRVGYEKPSGADEHLHSLTTRRFCELAQLVVALAPKPPPTILLSTPEFQSLALLHDIAGNPYRPAKFKPHWRTDTVTVLARQMYNSRDFGAMPILADALQDAGCDNEQVLTHCRNEGEHVRGCWVVDLVLGKE
jgi:hypothetical protein